MVVIIHFNKRGSGSGLPWTVHVRGQCIPASKVYILVPSETIYKPEKKSNPRAWIRCKGQVKMLPRHEIQITQEPDGL